MKHCKYEDFTHNPMTCFQVSDADTMIKYLEIIQTNIEFYKIFNLAVKRQFRNLNDFCHINDEYLKLIH
ncbi:MAG: hypothetical protein ACPHFR_08255, partial [Cycloclasticus sp.]